MPLFVVEAIENDDDTTFDRRPFIENLFKLGINGAAGAEMLADAEIKCGLTKR